ncbi:MAG: hypothetical protein AAGA02_11205 [Bacteroidota bacterium]
MKENYKIYGVSLITGAVLMVVTMVLHPAHLKTELLFVNMISHSLAILSLPFSLYGFWGLSRSLDQRPFAANVGFCFALFGLVAAMFAAAIDGLAASIFFKHMAQSAGGQAEVADLILDYSFALNNAVSYTFMGAIAIAIAFWSIAIVMGNPYKSWLGYLGLGLILTCLIAILLGTNFMAVWAFRLFIFGLVAWILLVSTDMIKLPVKSND